MSLDRAKAHLEQFGLAGRIQLFDVSSATVELAAQAVGCAPARIAKTLSFLTPDGPVLILAAGDANSAVKLHLDELERASQAQGWVDVCKGWQEEEP